MMMKVVSATMLVLAVSPDPDVTVLGRWCDEVWPGVTRILTIRAQDDGSVALEAAYKKGQGTRTTEKLRESASNIYFKIESQSGDRYRIVASTEHLQLIDNDGLIRRAERLMNTPQPGECGGVK